MTNMTYSNRQPVPQMNLSDTHMPVEARTELVKTGILPGKALKEQTQEIRKAFEHANRSILEAHRAGEEPSEQAMMVATMVNVNRPLLPSRQERKMLCRKLGIPFQPVLGYRGSSDYRWNL